MSALLNFKNFNKRVGGMKFGVNDNFTSPEP